MNKFWNLIKNIPTLESLNIETTQGIINYANKIGYPVVCKIWSDEISHKSDIGGVKVNIMGDQELKDISSFMVHDIREKYQNIIVKGVTIQKQAPSNGLEMIVGIKRDPQFGHTLMFGLGGIYAEVFKDISFRVIPFDKKEALKMISEIDSYPLLEGVRGNKPIDLQAIVNVIMELQKIVKENPEIEELDINPLMVYHDGCYAIDGRVF